LPHNDLTEIINSLTELKRMYQLNAELLEQLAVTCDWLRRSGVSLPNENAFFSLLNKAVALLNEIQADSPKVLIYQKLSDERKHPEESDGEVTEPSCDTFKSNSGIGRWKCFSYGEKSSS
jgi:hypothetical protein